MINSLLREICMLSIFCGLLLSFAPEGGAKGMAQLTAGVLLMLTIISSVRSIDYEKFSMDAADIKMAEAELTQNAQQANERLNRLVIESEYEAYIFNKAEITGCEISGLKLEMKLSEDGIWMPWAVEIYSGAGQKEKEALAGIIKDDLGITYERQSWS